MKTDDITTNDILAILDSRKGAMTIQECAELLRVDASTLYRHAHSGRFPTFRVAGLVRVNPAELAAQIRASSSLPREPVDRRKKRLRQS